jgi:ankyrin repeat protein
MYAAQFDLPETARILLDHGAEVNAQTNANPMIDANIVHDHRTVLMYAAENASRAMIELLLARTADPTAKDSTGRDVFDYLGRNTRLSAPDRSAVAQEIQSAMDRFKP